MNIKKYYLLVLFAFFLVSCLKTDNKQVLASVYDQELFKDEILNNIPDNIQDTAFFIERYTNKWIRTQLMIYNASCIINNTSMFS